MSTAAHRRPRSARSRVVGSLIATLVIVGVSGGGFLSGSAAAAPAATGDAPFTSYDLGLQSTPTDANSSDVVVGYVYNAGANIYEPTVWVNGQPIQLPDPTNVPTGTHFCGVPLGLRINTAGVVAATADFCPDHSTFPPTTYAVPVAWFPTNGVYGAAQQIDPSPVSSAEFLVDLNDAGQVTIAVNPSGEGTGQSGGGRIGHLDGSAAQDIPNARSIGSFLDSTRFLFISSVDGTAHVATMADPGTSSVFDMQAVALSGTGWVLGCATSPNACGSTLLTRDPTGAQVTLPAYPVQTSGEFGQPGIDQQGDAIAGQAVLYYLPNGASTWQQISDLFPAGSDFTMANNYVQVTRLTRAGDILGTDNEPGSDGYPEFRGFVLMHPHANPPVVNSTGDAAATNNAASGCTTGQTVTVNGQSEPECTLRAAIQAENAGSVDDKTITFDTSLTASSPAVISPATPLPTVTAAGITLDFASGTTGSSTVELVGSGGSSVGLDVKASGVTVKGLQVHGFGTGLLLDGPGHDMVVGSVLGQESGADAADAMGVEITSPDNVVGGSTAADRNVIAGNGTFGIYIHGTTASDTTITGDYIGVYADGQTEAANKVGVWIRDASGTTVGGSTATPGTGAGNLVNGGGTSDGAISVVGINAKVSGTVIAGNSFGLAADGTAFTSTCGQEVEVLGSTQDTRIGGDAGQGNVLDGLCQREVQVSSTQSSGAQILGNRIGTNLAGTAELAGFAVDNTAVAIGVSGATHTTIGQPGEANIVLGGFSSAIQTQTITAASTIEYPTSTPVPGTGTTLQEASSTAISGNSLGVLADVPSTSVLGTGIIVTGSGDTIDHNQIAVTPVAIDIEKATGTETVSANLLGVTAGGIGALPLADGVLVNSSAKATVTGNTIHAAGPAVALLPRPTARCPATRST